MKERPLKQDRSLMRLNGNVEIIPLLILLGERQRAKR